MQYPSVAPPGRPQVSNRSTSGAVVSNQPAEAANLDPLIGQKVWTRWPEDNNFYQALITDFKEVQLQYLLSPSKKQGIRKEGMIIGT